MRTVFSSQQLRLLESTFTQQGAYLSCSCCTALARELDVDEHVVKVWFQNRRAKEKMKVKVAEDKQSFPLYVELANLPAICDTQYVKTDAPDFDWNGLYTSMIEFANSFKCD